MLTSKPWSDVDLLVIGARLKVVCRKCSPSLAPSPPFALIFVHSRETVEQKVAGNGLFLKEVVTKGKVLYEKRNAKWVKNLKTIERCQTRDGI